jgi:hypothetical protein
MAGTKHGRENRNQLHLKFILNWFRVKFISINFVGINPIRLDLHV